MKSEECWLASALGFGRADRGTLLEASEEAWGRPKFCDYCSVLMNALINGVLFMHI